MLKSFRFSVPIIKHEKSGDNEDFYVTGYAATSDLDRQGDLILKDALVEAAKNLVNINNTVFFNHQYDLNSAVGRVIDAQVDDNGLLVTIYVSKLAHELRTKIQEGIISKFSIGGRLLEYQEISTEEAINRGYISKEEVEKNPLLKQITLIKKLELFEVSFVGIPANANACVVETFAKALQNCLNDNEGGETMDEIKELNNETIKDLLDEQEEEKSAEQEEQIQEVKEEEKSIEQEEKKEEDIEVEKKDEEDKKPYYYYYYGKDIKDMLSKLGDEVKDIKELINEVIKLLKEKAASTEGKKSLLKKVNVQENIDELFYKLIK